MNGDGNELFEEVDLFSSELLRHRSRFSHDRFSDGHQGLFFRDPFVIDEVVILLGLRQGLIRSAEPLLGAGQVGAMAALYAGGYQTLSILQSR